jgi:hypothetical protein
MEAEFLTYRDIERLEYYVFDLITRPLEPHGLSGEQLEAALGRTRAAKEAIAELVGICRRALSTIYQVNANLNAVAGLLYGDGKSGVGVLNPDAMARELVLNALKLVNGSVGSVELEDFGGVAVVLTQEELTELVDAMRFMNENFSRGKRNDDETIADVPERGESPNEILISRLEALRVK